MKKHLLLTLVKLTLVFFSLPVFSQTGKLVLTNEEAIRMYSNGLYDQADYITRDLLKISPSDTTTLRIRAQALTEIYYNNHYLAENYNEAFPILNQLISNGNAKLLLYRSRLQRSRAKRETFNNKELHDQYAQLALNDLLEYEKLFIPTKLTAYYKSDLLKMLGK